MTSKEVKKILELIKQECWDIVCIENQKICEACDFAISTVEKQEQDRWNPVSKYLPKKNGDYLVTCEVCGERYVEESFFCRCDNGGMFWTSQNVIAWQPRIEPYTVEEEA